MDTEVLHNHPEVRIPAELAFIDVDAVDAFRLAQHQFVTNAGAKAIENMGLEDAFAPMLRAKEAAKQQASQQLTAGGDTYIAQRLPREDNPELFDHLSGILKSMSVDQMSDTKWYLGDVDADGNYIPGTSGKEILRAKLAELVGMPDEDDDQPDDIPAPEEAELAQELKEIRDELAAISVKRSRLILKKSTASDKYAEEFAELDAQYNEVVNQLNGLKIAQLREAGKSEDELKVESIKLALLEHSAFTKAEGEIINSDYSRMGKITRFLAKSNRRFFAANFGLGAVMGFGSQRLLNGVLVGVVGVAAPAAIAAGLAVKTTKAVLSAKVGVRINQVKAHDKDVTADYEALEGRLNSLSSSDAGDAAKSTSLLRAVIAERIEKNRKYNRDRVIGAALFGAAGGIVGVEIANHFDFLGGGHGSSGHSNAGGHHHNHHSGNQHKHSGNNHNGNKHAATHKAGHTAGFDDNVKVHAGDGYTNQLQDLAAQKHIHLSSAQSWDLYQHLNNQFNGHFFSNDPSYLRSAGDYGISRPGMAHWHPAVVHAMNEWLKNKDLAKTS